MNETRTAVKLGLARKVMGYVRDPAVATWRKLTGLAAALYVVSPVDLIPDVPVVGWLDDLGVLSLVAWFLVRDIRRHAARQERPPGSDAAGRGGAAH